MGIDKEKINNKVSDITSTVKSKTSNIINNIEKTMVNAKDKTKDMVNSSKDKDDLYIGVLFLIAVICNTIAFILI